MVIMNVFILADESHIKAHVSAALNSCPDVSVTGMSLTCMNLGLLKENDTTIYISERPDLYIVGKLRFFCKSLIMIGDYNLGCELFILFSNFQGSSKKATFAAHQIKEFFKPTYQPEPFELPDLVETQREILGLMLLGYTGQEVINELSISPRVYQRNLRNMREVFEVANNETLVSTLHLLGYANEIINSDIQLS
jgi:DNA-binding CsgD family transcriptional regulator